MPSEKETIAFRVAASPLWDALHTRADRRLSSSLVAKRDLERYYELLRRSLPTFSEPEASLIVDACKGWPIESHSVPLLWARVDEAIRTEGLDRTWGVDGHVLVERLRALTPFEALAICDACERFWCRDNDDRVTGLRCVGLVRKP